MNLPKLAAIGLLPFIGPLSGRAAAEDQPSTQASAYQNSVEQDRLRAQTARVRKELLALLDEYKIYPAAAAEIAQAQAALASLETLSDQDMLAVVKILRQASQTGGEGAAKDQLLAASHDQKTIQSVLRELADKLALERDETAVRKRLQELLLRQMTHQHQTQKLVDGIIPSWEVERATKLAAEEQGAIKEEVTRMLAVLTKEAQGSNSSAQRAFLAALQAGANTQVAAQAEAAAMAAAAKNQPQAVAGQSAVISGLEAMLLAFDNAAPAQDRLQAMASAMKDLSARQDRLSASTMKVYFMNQDQIKEPQERIDDETAAISREIAQLSAPAGSELDHARQSMRNVNDAFKTKNYMEKEEKRGQIFQLQEDASESFAQTAALLQKQADSLAGAGVGQDAAPSTQDSALSQVEKAAGLIMKADAQMEVATGIIRQNSNPQLAKDMVGKAKDELSQAAAAIAALGDKMPSGEAGKKLQRADGSLADVLAKTGTSEDQMRVSWGVGSAREDAGLALAQLQMAANQLAANQAKGAVAKSRQPGAAGGTPGTPGNEDTSYSALATFSTKDREALAVLEHETTPPEYNTMVEQYRKNLANGELPAP